jgi:hypothetical protein
VSHSLDVDAPSTNGPPANTGVRDRFQAAWHAGDIERVRAALADDALLTLPEAPRAYSPADVEAGFDASLLATTVPSSIEVGSDGRVRSVTLTPLAATSAEPLDRAMPAPGRDGIPLPAALTRREIDLRAALGWSGRLLTTMAVVIGTLAAAAPILDAVYNIWPGLRPEGPAAALGMIVDDVQLEEGFVPCTAIPGTCHLVSYDLQLIGYSGAKSLVEWAAIDAETLQRVALPGGTTANRPEPPIEIVTEASSDRLSGSLEIPVPFEGECIIVRVYVYDDTDKTRVDYADTPPFDTHDPTASCSTPPSRGPTT